MYDFNMKKQQSFKFRFSTKFSSGWQNIEKRREIVLVVCFPFSERHHIFQRSERIDTDFTLLVY